MLCNRSRASFSKRLLVLGFANFGSTALMEDVYENGCGDVYENGCGDVYENGCGDVYENGWVAMQWPLFGVCVVLCL